MLKGLIRKSWGGRGRWADDIAFESTTFSLSTDIPRPRERRADRRLLALLPAARLVSDYGRDSCRVRNISAGGAMVETLSDCPVGAKVRIEFNSRQQVPGEIAWVREACRGIKFDQDIDLCNLLAHRPSRAVGQMLCSHRLDIRCTAELMIDGVLYRTQIKDISLGGFKVAISDWNCVNKQVELRLENLRPVKGVVRWYMDGHAGIVFKRPFAFKELAEWLGKRIEAASLKAGAWTKNSPC